MPSALVVNCSAPRYNLGALKLADWLRSTGYVVDLSGDDGGLFDYDLVCVSVVFSWDAPKAAAIANRRRGVEVWAGGPGLFQLRGWWRRETGLECVSKIDQRFDRQRGNYLMTFASRGCPVGCYFCIVPRLEGTDFTLDWDFEPAPMLCDNNLSALPVDFQEHIIRRYQDRGVKLADANSGFEPRTFDAGTYARWRPVLKGPWRFAYDDILETEHVRTMMALLKEEPSRRKRVYVLVGNEPIESCFERAQRVIEWGGEPHCQFVLPLNWLGDPATLKTRYDWTYRLGRDFCRYYNAHVYKACALTEYSDRKGERPPFGDMRCLVRPSAH